MVFSNPNIKETGILVGIDPGTTTLGLAITKFNFKSLKIESMFTKTILVKNIPHDNVTMSEHNELIHHMAALNRFLYDVFVDVGVSVVATESPFFNRFRPNSYASLLMVMDAIQKAVIQYSPITPYHTYPPGTVKKYINAKSFKGKSPVLDAIKHNTEIMENLTNDITTITEHEIDALAVTYSYICELRDMLGYPYSVEKNN